MRLSLIQQRIAASAPSTRCGVVGLLVVLVTCGSGCSSPQLSTGADGGGTHAGGVSAGGSSDVGASNGGGMSAGGTAAGGPARDAGTAGTGTGAPDAGGGVGMDGAAVDAEGDLVSTLRGCDNPAPYHVSNGPMTSPADTGFDICANSWVARRRVAEACPPGPTTPNANQCSPSYCSSDADCTRQPHGFCAEARHLAGYCGCYYGCMQDSDCDSGSICFCGTPVGHCVPATCADDSSCASGSMCASYLVPCDGGVSSGGGCTGAVNGCFAGFACQTSADACLYDTDCPTGSGRCNLRGGVRRCDAVCPGPPPPAL
jgi:hypothetical protein